MPGTRWDVFVAGCVVVLGTALWQGCGGGDTAAKAAAPSPTPAPAPRAPAPAVPQDEGPAPENLRKMADRQLVEGRLVSIGAWLEKTHGAKAQPELFSQHALGLVTADGTLFTLVNNAHGNPIITNPKLRDQEVRLFGWRYPKTQYVEVWSYDRKGADGGWERMEWCKVCGYESAGEEGTQDTDLCNDCAGR